MANEFPKTIITAFTIMGAWHKGPAAPNGSTPGMMERHGVEVTIYAADYYGNGPKRYASGTPLFQDEYTTAPRPMPGGWNDGSESRISELMARAGVAVG